jgi:hypothetical protein
MSDARWQDVVEGPCNLPLVLLGPRNVCPRCRYFANVHPEWIREMKRTGKGVLIRFVVKDQI